MLKKANALGNIEIDSKRKYALLSVNPELFPLENVLAAAREFMGKACVMLDGNPKEEILVELRLKQKGDIKSLAFEFSEALARSR